MLKSLRLLVVVAALVSAGAAHATASTVFWTPATTYIQPAGVPHLTFDTYFGTQGDYPLITGLTVGLLPFDKLQAEVGFDVLLPLGIESPNPFQLNAKIGSPEGSFFAGSPGWSAGIFGVGFEEDLTDPTVLHGEISKALPVIGTLAAGGYYAVDEGALGVPGGDKAGFMASWTSPDLMLNLPGLHKIIGVADVMTGNNNLGAAGGGLGIYFTPAINLLAGPVFFFEPEVQPGGADWLFSMQVDIDFDLIPDKKDSGT